MVPTYRRDGDHNYMVLTAPCPVTGEEYQVRMVTRNRIPGFLACKERSVDGKAEFFYEITSLAPLAGMFESRRMGVRDIRQLMEGIQKALQGASEYLLDGNDILLDPETIYMNAESREVFLCLLPFHAGNIQEAFRALAEYILKRLDHADREAVLWGYEIYSKTAEENYSIQKLLEDMRQRRRIAEKKRPAAGARPRPQQKRPQVQGEQKKTEREPDTERAPKKAGKPAEKKPAGEKAAGGEKETWGLYLKKALPLAAGLAVITGLTWLAARCIPLTLLQAGAVFFGAAGVFLYLAAFRQKPKKKKKRRPGTQPGAERKALLWEEEETPADHSGAKRLK